GELGAVRLIHDGLGRLTALVPERGEPLSLRYDARGRLAGLSQAGRVLHRFTWGPAVDDGPAALLASGVDGASSWMPGPAGPAGVAGSSGLVDVVLGLGAAPWWLIPQGSDAVMPTDDIRGYTQVELGEGADADLVGPGARLIPLPGGPLLALSPAEGGAVPAGTALDPLSGQRTDGLQPLPWQIVPFYQDGSPAELDPAPWEPNPTWQQPLRLLVAMGELADPMPGPWTLLPALPIATPVLPASLDQIEPPLGPPLDALPIAEDPLTTAWLLACLPGAAPPDADLAARTILSTVLSLPWLPPGVDLPLPLRWSPQRIKIGS
ncbi:MAG: RHS repeat protein, partial [Oligoflexia bacterium]|nr:RHS repeat protein [Oligoflexia bacterium]